MPSLSISSSSSGRPGPVPKIFSRQSGNSRGESRPGLEQAIEPLAPRQRSRRHHDRGVEGGALPLVRRSRVGDAHHATAPAHQLAVLGGGALRERGDGVEARIAVGDRADEARPVAVQVHVVLADADHALGDMARDGEVEGGSRGHEHAVAHGSQEPQQRGVGEGAEPRIAGVLAVDQPAGGLVDAAPDAPERLGPEVDQRPEAHARVELEARPLLVAVAAHHLDLVVARELTGRREGRADRAAHGIGVGYEEADDHGERGGTVASRPARVGS